MMTELESRGAGARYLLTFACLVVVVAGLRAASTLVIPILLAMLIALLSLPLQNFLRGHGVPTILAVIATVLADIALLALVGLLVVGSVNEFTTQLPKYQTSIEQLSTTVVDWVTARGIPLEAGDFLNAGSIVGFVRTTISGIAAVLQNFVLVILITIFVLFEAAYFPKKLRRALGLRVDRLDRLSRMVSDVQRYLGVKTVVSLATGSLIALWLAILGVDFPIFWGLVAFFLNYIPNLGSILASIPTVLLAFVQLGLGRAALVALGYLVVNILLGNFVEPTIMGRRFGLSTLIVFLSLVFWGWVWGPVGMLLSVPLTMILKIMLENSEDLRWIAVLMGSTSEPKTVEPSASSAG